MSKFYDIDFSLDFVSKALREGGFDGCRVRIAMSNYPEKMKPVLRQAIEANDEKVFCFFVEHNIVDSVKEEKNYPYKNVWDELLVRGKRGMIKAALNSEKHVMTMENLTDLKSALIEHRVSIFSDKKRHLEDLVLSEKINSLQAKMMASSCYSLDSLDISDKGKGDFPPVMIASFGHRCYRFDALKRDKIKEKGMQNYLFEILEKHIKEVEKNAISDKDKNKRLCDTFEQGKDFEGEPVSVSDALEIRQEMEMDKKSFYKNEFEKTQKFYEIYNEFCKSENAPLAKLFEKQEKTMVLFKDAGQITRGQMLGNFVVLANVDFSVLHHELIHNLDEKGVLSQTPFFKKMYSYAQKKMEDADLFALFGRQNFWCTMRNVSKNYKNKDFSAEMLPFFASITDSRPDFQKPAFVKKALAVVNAYAEACVQGDGKEKNRIIQALNQTDMPSTAKGFDDYLKGVLMPVKARHKSAKCINSQKENG